MRNHTTLKGIGFILAVAVIFFGGIGITGAAAQSAIPGDALYPVKTTIENTRLSLAKDAFDRAQMKLTFAEQRLSEISGLIREGRYREIREAVLAFEGSINAAIMELETVSASDPARAAAITQEVTSALTRYAQMLSDLAAIAPDSIKPEMTRALDTTQIASDLGQSAGNENSNANDNSSVDNGNVNTNDNANTNGDDISNDNSSADDNANDNSNDDNSNADDKGNDNGSDDNSNGNAIYDSANNNGGDDNSNDNSADDNSNADDNGNDNGVDDNSNDDNSGGNSGSDDSSGKGGGSDDNGSDDNSGKGGGKDD